MYVRVYNLRFCEKQKAKRLFLLREKERNKHVMPLEYKEKK